MEFTGERVVPGLVEADLFNEHLARYVLAEKFVAGKRVLDAGCGSGYGAARLASRAQRVVGIDNSAEAIAYARTHYVQPNLSFSLGDCQQMAFADRQFDVIVTFEVIEHLPNYERFLAEIKRVLRPGGILLLSTPNRVYYSEEREQANPFHFREFNRQELKSELGRYFAHVRLLAENHAPSLVLTPVEGASSIEALVERGPRPEDEPHFWMGVCSAEPLPSPLPALCYVPDSGNILREREKHVRLLKQEVDELKKIVEDLQKQFEERSAWAVRLAKGLKEREEALRKLQTEFDDRSAWAARLDKELKAREEALGKLQAEYDDRTAWALQLDAELKKAQQQIINIKKSRAYRLAKFLRLV